MGAHSLSCEILTFDFPRPFSDGVQLDCLLSAIAPPPQPHSCKFHEVYEPMEAALTRHLTHCPPLGSRREQAVGHCKPTARLHLDQVTLTSASLLQVAMYSLRKGARGCPGMLETLRELWDWGLRCGKKAKLSVRAQSGISARRQWDGSGISIAHWGSAQTSSTPPGCHRP